MTEDKPDLELTAIEVAAMLRQDVEVPLGMRSRVEAGVFRAMAYRRGRSWPSWLVVSGVVFATLSARASQLPETSRLTVFVLTGPLLCGIALLALGYARLVLERPQRDQESANESPGSSFPATPDS